MKKNIAKSSMIIFIITLLSKFMGTIRQSILNNYFGQTAYTDVYYSAFKIAMLATFVINTTIHLAIIPIISKVREENGIEQSNKYFSSIISITTIINIILTMLLIIFAPILAKLIVPGFTEEQYYLTVKMVRIMSPSIIFLGMISCIGGYLQSNYSFAPYAAIGIVNNIVFFIILKLYGENANIELVAYITMIGAVIQAVYLMVFLFKFKFKYNINIHNDSNYIGQTFILLLPLMLNDMINQVVGIFNNILGSTLEAGSISILNNSYNLFNAILGLFVATIATVIYPVLAQAFNSKDFKLIKKYVDNGIVLLMILLIPATIGIIVLSEPIVKLLFERGKFTPEDTLLTQKALVLYGLGFFANGIKIFLNKVYFSYQDTITPFKNQIYIVLINIGIAIPLVRVLKFQGLALASSIAAIFGALYLLIKLKYKIEDLNYKKIIISFFKVLIPSIVMGVVVYTTYNISYSLIGTGFFRITIRTLISIIIGVITYGIFLYMFKIEELRTLISKFKKPLKK